MTDLNCHPEVRARHCALMQQQQKQQQQQQQQQEQQQALHIPYLLIQQGASPCPTQQEGVRYCRDGIRQILGCMGVKHRHAFKIAQLLFLRVGSHLPELAKKPHHRRVSSCMHWAVWPHGKGGAEVCVSLPRSEFYELLCTCLVEHNYKCTPSSEELRVACRCVFCCCVKD